MDPVGALQTRGGVASFGELVAAGVEPRVLSAALAGGLVCRPHRGVYALPDRHPALVAAKRLGGVVSHLSAAQAHRLETLTAPDRSHVTVPRGRRKIPLQGVSIHRADLVADEIDPRWPVTAPLRTLLDCLRVLPMRESVVIGDSALRVGGVSQVEVLQAVPRLRGNGSAAARSAAARLDPRCESVLESVGRVEMHLGGLPTPLTQVVVDTPLGPRRLDFYFADHNVGVETDGFATHGLRSGLVGDCVRHNAYALAGVLVVRFAWEHVVGTPQFFVETVGLALDLGAARKAPQCRRCGCPVVPMTA